MKKSLASVTVAASLLGGATGAIVFAPNLVSAQTEAETPADTEAEPTQTEAETPAETETDSDAPFERGAWLAEVLDGLVADGTLTEGQADAVADAIAEARPERGEGHWGRGHGGEGLDELTDLLGLEPAEIAEALRSGESLADVAAAQGVDPQEIIDAMVERATERIDQAVADGRLDEAEAAERLAEITERITDGVNGEFDLEGRRGLGRFGDRDDRGGRHFGGGPFGGGDSADDDADA